MTSLGVREQRPADILKDNPEDWSGEVVALCPHCKALQTLAVTGDAILPTRKYIQRGTQVYHDCGGGAPCRLFRIL
jgi:hypothetical protein